MCKPPCSMKKTQNIELNDYHKARNERMARKISQQPLMSAEQFKRIAEQSQRPLVKISGR